VKELHSYAVFCDDVRSEANGKNFFIGVYQGSMIFEVPPPWALPIFTVHVVLRVPLIVPTPEAKISVEAVTAGGRNTLWTATLAADQEPSINISRLAFENPGDSDQTMMTRFNVQFSPLIIEEETRLEVCMKMGEGEPMLIDRLRVSAQTVNAAN
jgi:hypothetical protein